MVIISAAICTKAGKLLVSRQYTNISKLALEEHIRNFPKSIHANQQHTFVETDSIRYIYLPLETMYLVLLTNKNSNVIEDLEAIRLVHKVVLDICSHGVTETNIKENYFELLLGFDDVISFGFRENVTLNQVQSALAMESSDEKLHLMMLKARMNEAKEASKKAQLEMKKKQKDPGYKPSSSFSSESSESFVKKTEQEVIVNAETKPTIEKETKGPVNHAPKKGLQIVKKKESKAAPTLPKKEEMQALITQEEPEKKYEYNPLQAPILVEFEEKLVCALERDGSLSGFEIKGDIFLTVRDPTKGNCVVFLETEPNKAISLKPNPQLNKQFWSEKQALAPKDVKDVFAVGSKINCLKYRYASNNANDLPFTFTYWANPGSITCELEYNSGQNKFPELNDVSVYISFPNNQHPEVTSIENGDYEINKSASLFRWLIRKLDSSNTTANIEIKFSSNITPDDLFPFSVDFKLDYNFYKVGIKSAAILSDKSTINAEFMPSFAVEKFEIQ